MGKYQQYLQSEHWQTTRKEKQRSVRSGKRCLCEECRVYFPPRFMHTHNTHYQSLGAEKLKDLQSLCIWCHAAKHGKKCNADKSRVMLVIQRGTMSDGEMNELRNAFLNALQSSNS